VSLGSLDARSVDARPSAVRRNACLVIARDKSESNILPVPVSNWSEPKLLLPLNGQAQTRGRRTSAVYPVTEIAQTALLSRFMTGLLGCRSPRLAARQSFHRSVTSTYPSCVVFHSQHQCSQSTKPVSHAWARSQRGSLSATQLVRGRSMSVKANREPANGEHANSDDLLVVGPGVLGSYVGMLWQQQHSTATVTGQTNSTTNHDRYYITFNKQLL